MGRIYAKGDTLITTADNFKIFLSINRGENWKQFQFPTPPNADILRIMGIEVLGDFIYAITWYEGIYKSSDLLNWQKLNYSTSCYSICKDYSGILYAGSEDGKIYRSSDEGINWVLDLSDTLSRPIWKIFLSRDSSVLAGTRGKLLRKRPNSSIWEETVFPGFSDIQFIMEDDLNYLYISSYSYVKRSTDDGQTWENMDINGFLINNTMFDLIYNSRIIGAFQDDTGLFGNGWGAAVSDDRGITWRWSQTGLQLKTTGFKLAKSGADTYLITRGAGVFKSTDYGDSWFAVNNGINAAVTRNLVIDPEGIFYAASWSSGLSRSTDKGESWQMINNGVNNVYFYSIIADDKGILLAGSDQGTFRSTDKGENWIRTTPPGNDFVIHFRKDKNNRIYGLTSNGIHRTTDLGLSWQRIDKNFASSYVLGLAIDSNGDIYAGDISGAIYKSTDDGSSWTKVYQSQQDLAYVRSICISATGEIYAAIKEEGILRSTDQGQSWEIKNSGIPTKNARVIRVRDNGDIYTSAYFNQGEGLYYSTNNGESWTPITGNLKSIQVRDIIFHEKEIYLATNESVWKNIPDSVTNAAEDDVKPKEYFLSQNYPNPFNPTTTIKYSLAQAGRVTLSIFDLLGREVIKLIDEEKPAGEYETKWNASSYPSGVYFLKMQAGQFTQTRKLILVK